MGPRALSRVASFVQQPAYGQVRVSNELKTRAISVSAGVCTIWHRAAGRTHSLSEVGTMALPMIGVSRACSAKEIKNH